MALVTREIAGNSVRVPDPREGEVGVVSRYGKERAMLVHPEDFRRFEELDRLLADLSSLGPIQPSEEALRAHVEEGTPGEPVTDPACLAKLFS